MEAEDILSSRQAELSRLCRKEKAELLVLFGSCATGSVHAQSDIDPAVQMERGTQPSKLHLIYELETVLEPWHVDLVLLTPSTDPLLLHEIFMKGKVLFEARPGLFQKARLRAWHLYLDTEKLRKSEREYVQDLVERVKGVS